MLLVIAAGVALVVLVLATGVVQRLFSDDCEEAYGSGWMTAPVRRQRPLVHPARDR